MSAGGVKTNELFMGVALSVCFVNTISKHH